MNTRADETDCLWIPVRLMDGELLEFGHSEDCRGEYGDCEWLGPFTASDFEQLIRLREAGEKVLEWFAGFPHQGVVSDFDRATAEEVYAVLRHALSPQKGNTNE